MAEHDDRASGEFDDELDPRLVERFDAITRLPAPDVWSEVGTAGESTGPSRRVMLSMAAAVAFGALGAVWLLPDRDSPVTVARNVVSVDGTEAGSGPEDELDPARGTTGSAAAGGAPSSAPGGGSDPGMPAEVCAAEPLAEQLRQGLPDFDYEPSESLSALVQSSRLIVRGQIVAGFARAGGTVLVIKPRDSIGPGGESGELVMWLWTPAALPSTGVIDGGFVAFLSGEQMTDPELSEPAWDVDIEGLWIGCGDSTPAVSVLVDPVGPGWRQARADGLTLDSLWRAAQFPAGQLIQPLGLPSVVADGVAVYDVRLVDGERFRLSIPEALAAEMTLTQRPAPAPVVLEGSTATIAISYQPCGEEDGLSENSLGSLVVVGADRVRVCRPEEFLVVDIVARVSLDNSDVDSFDLRPIEVGARYGAVLSSRWPELASCSGCGKWGPAVFFEDNVVVNKTGATVVTAVDLDTLAKRWAVDTGGFGTNLHRSSESVWLEVTGGPFLSLDPSTGSEQWRIERDSDERDAAVSHERNAWYLRSSFSIEGDETAPLLRRFDPGTGEVLWSATGRERTVWPNQRPVLVDGAIVLMDVADVPGGDGGSVLSSLRAYDEESGALLWTADLDSPNGASGQGWLAVVNVGEEALIVGTIDGEVLRIDPDDGRIMWRAAISQTQFSGTDHAADGTLALDVLTRGGRVLLDPATGERLDDE